ncbi:hypothetical protein ACOCEA_04005 [Maribacter sp. CXY002]|uniref:hypothetical protein n=1 Tax=Maribacter luteocoastalis TaxID=3407671 RepID=UPI003B67AE7B
MKTIVKKPFKFLILFVMPSLFILGCIDKDLESVILDDQEMSQQNLDIEDNTKINLISSKDVPDVVNVLSSISGKNLNDAGKVLYNNTRIDLDSISEVINIDDGTNYTLEMRVKNAPANHIYNLVFHRNTDGALEEPYVIRYEIETEHMPDLMLSDGDLSFFIGKYRFYKFNQFFEDTKANRVGKSGDCGGGYTGGTSGPPIAPGSTFTQTFDGRTMEAIFSSQTTVPYNFSHTIRTENGVQTHVATATSGVVTFPNATPYGNYTITTHSNTASVNVTTDDSGGGGGAPCTNGSQISDSGIVDFNDSCPDAGSNSNKASVNGKLYDCGDPQGSLAIRGYDRPVQKIFYFMDESLTWEEINFLEDNNGFPEILVAFFAEFTITNETKDFVDEAIDAAVDGSIITLSPFVKYPKNSNYSSQYKKLTEYLKNQLPKVGKIDKIIDAIHLFTKLPKEQIKLDLQWGEGPFIEIVQLDNFPNCNTCSNITVGHFAKESNPNTLYLDIDYVNQMENGTLAENDNDAAIFFIGTTILHEYVHYGDYTDGFDYPGEEGWKFEIMVYGNNVNPENARFVLNKISN